MSIPCKFFDAKKLYFRFHRASESRCALNEDRKKFTTNVFAVLCESCRLNAVGLLSTKKVIVDMSSMFPYTQKNNNVLK